jgi:hypothetical protein
MTNLTINSITGLVPPYSGFACDVYGNQCVYIGQITVTPVTITLPPQFDTAPAIGLKLIDSTGCERLITLICIDEGNIEKQFQDGDLFFFMDYQIFQFQ